MSGAPIARAIAAAYRSAGTAPFAGMLAAAADALDAAGPLLSPGGTLSRLPVLGHLDAAIACGRAGPLRAIAEAFAPSARALTWQQNPNYVAHPPSADFLDRYGYCEPLGPGRSWPHPRLRIGFLLLAPETHYPSHHHPAAEVYHIVAGRSAWWHPESGWQMREAGAAIHHAPHVPHATHAGPEPLLALYCWSGDIDAAARLSPGEKRA